MTKSIYIVCLQLLALSSASLAQNIGNENQALVSTGQFVAFANQTIHVINPANLTIAANITTDQSNQPLTNAQGQPRNWNNGVFLNASNLGAGLVLVNEADQYTVNGNPAGYVTVVRVGSSPAVVGRIAVGARPVNIYSINSTGKVWTRSGADGQFYVISVNSLSPFNATTTTVPAFSSNRDTGTLVLEDTLTPIAYGTNVAEPVIFKYNLAQQNRTNSFNFQTANCSGLNTAVYSRVNRHVYAECVNNGGVLEWNTATDTLVGQHAILGTLTVSPAGDRILATQLLNSTSTIIVPGANGARSTVERVIAVGGQPDTPVFFSNSTSSTPQPFSAYTVFYPLARNTQKYLVRATNDAVTQASYYVKPTDCQYDNASVSTSSIPSASAGLQLAQAANGSILTPACGACAPGIQTEIGNITNFYYQLGGFGVLPLGGNASNTTTVQAGAIQPRVNAASGANQCSYATPARDAKRGGSFVATVADLPQPSVYIVPGVSSTNSIGFVPTAERPRKVVWAPAI